MMLSQYKAIIFDMDGLVLDTEACYFIAWQQAAKEMGFILSDGFCIDLSGSSFSVLEKQLSLYFGVDFSFPEFCQLSNKFWQGHVEKNGIEVKSGVHDLIAYLQSQNLPYCLATNSPEKNARECLQYAGVESLFDLIVCRDHVEFAKPAADIFLRAAELLKQPIQNCLVVEDSYVGLKAAKQAGIDSVLIPSLGVSPEMQSLAGLVMGDLTQLCHALKNPNN
jgi:HAD superfamily hydrolase (TIGR01509 family)